jgi:hypothetical protein
MKVNNLRNLVVASFALAAFGSAIAAPQGMMMMEVGAFKGIEVNKGKVSASVNSKGIMLTLSKDFMIPKSPAPHWQVVDSNGNVYLLNQLMIAGKKENRSIQVPSYVSDVKTVRIWCSFAEVNLGEASFSKAVAR